MASLIHTDEPYQRKADYKQDLFRLGSFDWRFIIAKGNIIEGIEAKE